MSSIGRARFLVIVTVVVGACRYGFDVAPPADTGAPDPVDSAIDELPGCIRDVVPSTLTTCVLFRDGHVECIGRGTRGELGDGVMHSVTSLARVLEIDDAVKLVGAAYGFCVIRADRTAWCWGDTQGDRFGALGTADLFVPAMVPSVSNVTDIDSGTLHTCVVTDHGAVSCWGDNGVGQLGEGTTTPSSTPVAVSLPGPATRVMAGWGVSCALLEDGRAFCWGANGVGNWSVPNPAGSTQWWRSMRTPCRCTCAGKTARCGRSVATIRGNWPMPTRHERPRQRSTG